MTPTLERAATRDSEAVRLSIDSKRGPGVRLVAADAVLELEPVEHVGWALDNLLACRFEGRVHLWDQGFNSPASSPGRPGTRRPSSGAR